MSSASQFLVSIGIDPLVVGLVAGALLMIVVRSALKNVKVTPNTFAAGSFTAGPAKSSPVSISTKRSIHFRINLNGTEHSLTDDQTSSVIEAVKSGDRAGAVHAVQSGLDVSPEVAGKIVDALAKAHLS